VSLPKHGADHTPRRLNTHETWWQRISARLISTRPGSGWISGWADT